MGKGFAITNYDGVCKCDNPKIVIRGYSGQIKKQPIYYCCHCRHQFKSSSKKWGELAKINKLVEEKIKEYTKQHTAWILLKYGNTYIGYDVWDTETVRLMNSLKQLIEFMKIEYSTKYPLENDDAFYIIMDGEDEARAEFFQKFFDNGYKLTWK